jgi:BioD-like phosphotransacetylase family protein
MARSIVVFAEGSQHGKTVIATGIAERLHNAGHEPLLIRVGDAADSAATSDAEFFSGLPYGVGDAPLGITQAASMLGDLGRAILVAEISADLPPATAATKLDGVALAAGSVTDSVRRELGPRLKGWVAFTEPRADALALVPEDPVLLAPRVRDALAALPQDATVRFLDDSDAEICESIAIAPISHDTGRMYFALDGKSVAVCRDDKPEIALAALAGDTSLLVITGGDEPLGYVAERAAAAHVPMVVTREPTVETVQRLEAAFAPRPIRHPRQVKRAAVLLSEIDLDSLLANG